MTIDRTFNESMALSVVHLHSPVSHVITRPAVHVSSHDSLTLVSKTLRSNNVSAALVGPDRNAIVTERDLTRALAAEYPADMPVVRVATPLPISVPADTDILEAAALMLNQDVRHLIVDLPDGSAGIVSMRDIMAVLLQAAKPELWLSGLRLRVEIPTESWLG